MCLKTPKGKKQKSNRTLSFLNLAHINAAAPSFKLAPVSFELMLNSALVYSSQEDWRGVCPPLL